MLGSPRKRNKLFDLIRRISFPDGGMALRTRVALLAVAAGLGLALPSTFFAQGAGPPSATRAAPASMARIEIAPRAMALTFARHRREGVLKLLLIERFEDNHVEGIDLSASLPGAPTDPIALFNSLGYAALREATGPRARVAVPDLVLPFAGTARQIAIGINYPEHGNEVAVRDSFVFPKQVTATPHTADVPARDHLLDYEIELGFVALAPIARGSVPRHMGLTLASDYTDRAALLRHVRMTDVASGAGFTTAKSAAGFMPVGNLLVIPADLDSFVGGLRLTLAHNGAQRQDAHPSRMVWKLARMLEESFAREALRWDWNGRPVALPIAGGAIPARTLILSGTPDGVLYRKPTVWQLTRGVVEMIATLRWFSPNRVLEPHIRDEVAAGRYLQPGDVVEMRADRLGTIRNRIVP